MVHGAIWGSVGFFLSVPAACVSSIWLYFRRHYEVPRWLLWVCLGLAVVTVSISALMMPMGPGRPGVFGW